MTKPNRWHNEKWRTSSYYSVIINYQLHDLKENVKCLRVVLISNILL